jgi:hypothetical protein
VAQASHNHKNTLVGDIEITEGPVIPDTWRAVRADRPVPLQQHWAYAGALERIGADVRQLTILQAGQPVALAVTGQRRFYRLLGITSLMRGPLWLDGAPDDATKIATFRALRARHSPWRWHFLALQPELPDTPETTAIMKAARLRRIMTGYTTAWLDLRPSVDTLRAGLNGKWRNQLKGAEKKSPISISIGGRKPHQYRWLLEQEDTQQIARGYHSIPTGLVEVYSAAASAGGKDDPSGVLTVTAMAGRDKLAGGLFLVHGTSATYHIGWTSDDGRRANAQNRVLWEAVLALKDRGVCFFDLGGMNTETQAGVTRFKLGLGAAPVTLAGTFA